VPEVVRVSVLCRLIEPNKPAFTRVRATECVMNHATNVVEIEDIEQAAGRDGATAMKSIDRRIRNLEDRLGPAVETEFSRRLRQRIEAPRPRVAEAKAPGELHPCPDVRAMFKMDL
jgi:hypothetical protein